MGIGTVFDDRLGVARQRYKVFVAKGISKAGAMI